MRTVLLGSLVELPKGHETREGCAEMGGGTQTKFAPGASGVAPHGATKRVRGVPK